MKILKIKKIIAFLKRDISLKTLNKWKEHQAGLPIRWFGISTTKMTFIKDLYFDIDIDIFNFHITIYLYPNFK